MRRIAPTEITGPGVFIASETPTDAANIHALQTYAAQLGISGPAFLVSPPAPKSPKIELIEVVAYDPTERWLGDMTWGEFTAPIEREEDRAASFAYTVLRKLSIGFAQRPRPRHYEDRRPGLEVPFMKFPEDYYLPYRSSLREPPLYRRGSKFKDRKILREATLVELDRLHPIVRDHRLLEATGGGPKSHNAVAKLLNRLVEPKQTHP